MLEATAHPPAARAATCASLAAEARRPAARATSCSTLVELDAAADRKVGGFSLGMRQRLGLAGALMGDPRVLVLDEPANGLDPEGIRWLRDFLRGLAAEGRTILLSSHVLAEVAQTVDDVVVISGGRLVAHAPLERADRRRRRPGRVRVALAGPRAARRRAARRGLVLVRRGGRRARRGRGAARRRSASSPSSTASSSTASPTRRRASRTSSSI